MNRYGFSGTLNGAFASVWVDAPTVGEAIEKAKRGECTAASAIYEACPNAPEGFVWDGEEPTDEYGDPIERERNLFPV